MIETLRACVADEFAQVNQLIIDQLHSDVDMVENIGHYIVDAGGKRMRPLLALLSARALGECSVDHVRFAAVVEFIHTATLLHDDVVDVSKLRRGRITANEQFGNAPSVLVGDFIYTRAFQLMVQLDNLELLRYMADTTNSIAEGEVLQLVRAGDPSVNEGQYLEVITRKTAVLFASACHCAALVSRADNETADQLGNFGLNLGIAFQMIDDVLDYSGDAVTIGKNVGDDLREGKVTLPLIHAMKHGSDVDRELIARAILQRSNEELAAVVEAVQRSGGIDYTRERARQHRDEALASLRVLPQNAGTEALRTLAAMAVDREK